MTDRLVNDNDGCYDGRNCKYRYRIDEEIDNADIWIVWGGLPPSQTMDSCYIPVGNSVFITDEVFPEKSFLPQFLNQFDHILSPRDDIEHRGIVKTHELNTWHMDVSYENARNLSMPRKSKTISCISSDLTILPGHKQRFAFVNKLIGHFKGNIDFFGRGFKPIPDKWPALAPYMYSIAIENNAIDGYFTEKISECFLAGTIPIYYGAPNIASYFPSNSLIQIDINNFDEAVSIIEDIIANPCHETHIESVVKARILYLEEYHIFNALPRILDKVHLKDSPVRKKVIRNDFTYQKGYNLSRLVRAIKKFS
jgi:hypothetical protein